MILSVSDYFSDRVDLIALMTVGYLCGFIIRFVCLYVAVK